MNTIDPSGILGVRFSRLVPIEFKYNKGGHKFYLCQCDCGKQSTPSNYALLSGNTKSCGCLALEIRKRVNITHGLSKSPEYHAWNEMKKRCNNPNSNTYNYYGGRGIKVCDRWQTSFENFLKDMGNKPTPQHSIDRKNVEKGYSPDNCRWATWQEQASNRHGNRYLTVNGEQKTITEWSRIYNIERKTVSHRIDLGMSTIDALTITPDCNKTRKLIYKNQ